MKNIDIENPLCGKAVLDITEDDMGLKAIPGKRKVRRAFELHDGNMLLPPTDIMGAFDQPHVTVDGLPAHYAGKGEIINWLNLMAKQRLMHYVPTDYLPVENYPEIPEKWRSRSSIHVPAKKRILVECIERGSSEGSMDEDATEGKQKCGQDLPKDLKLGDILPRPFFTPTSKSEKGKKDKDFTLIKYFEVINDYGIAQYIYGISTLIFLLNRVNARDKGFDWTDEKLEFGIFSKDAPIHRKPNGDFFHSGQNWGHPNVIARMFTILCGDAGFNGYAWEKMPEFDFKIFCEFAAENAKTCTVRLYDECGTTDSGRVRLLADTLMGQKLIKLGQPEQAKVLFQNYYCKEHFRLESKRTGKGGYKKSATEKVVVPDAVLRQTGARNYMYYLKLKY